MATLTKGQTFGASETITNTKLHNLVDLGAVSNIVNADIDAAAAIIDTKLAQITTVNKISGTALGNLASIPSGAGLIPFANIGVINTSMISYTSIPNASLLPLTLTSWVDGSAMRNIQSMPSLAGQLAWYSIVSSLASGGSPIFNGVDKLIGGNTFTPYTSGDYFVNGNFYIGSTSATSGAPAKVSEMYIPKGGTLRIKFWLGGDAGTCSAQIYRNGSAVGTLRSNATAASAATYSEDISGWSAGDLLQIYAYNSSGSNTTYVAGPLVYEGTPDKIEVNGVTYLQPDTYVYNIAVAFSSSLVQTLGKRGDLIVDQGGAASTTLYVKTAATTWTAK